MVVKSLWLKWRDEARSTFLKDIEIGYADRDIVPIVRSIFEKCQHVFTISSCSGRITVVDAPYPWVRKEATIIFKKHTAVMPEEIAPLLEQPCTHRLWIISSGPIIHFVADSIDNALKLLSIARESGFKHSGIISVREDGVVVELISGNWISMLLRDADQVIIDRAALPRVLTIFNDNLLEGKQRLQKLHQLIASSSL